MEKTIQILAKNNDTIPRGTKLKQYNFGKLNNYFGELNNDFGKIREDLKFAGGAHWVYEVDFSEVPPLYPHKGMIVPEKGIEFADGNGRLIDVGVNGFTLEHNNCDDVFFYWIENIHKRDGYRLKRTLPKTITVCADCFKEVCECEHEKEITGQNPIDSRVTITVDGINLNGKQYTFDEFNSIAVEIIEDRDQFRDNVIKRVASAIRELEQV